MVKVNLFFSNCDRIFNSCDSFLHILRYSDIIISLLYGDKAKLMVCFKEAAESGSNAFKVNRYLANSGQYDDE